jgi:hypothetical protein
MFKLFSEIGSDIKRAFQQPGGIEQFRAQRLPATRLRAVYGSGSASWLASVKNISSTGVYLATEKRLRTGEIITLVLVEDEGSLITQPNPDCKLSVHARVARQGEDGIGLSFLLPPGLDKTLWEVLLKNLVQLDDQKQIEEMFLMLRTILFECHLCHSGAEEAMLLLGGQLNPVRSGSLVKIAIAAEEMLAQDRDFEHMRVHPGLIAHILREGCWTQDPLVIQLWAGLLAASCSPQVPDDSNWVLASLLRHIGPIEARVFTHACEQSLAAATVADPENIASAPAEIPQVHITSGDMRRVTGRPDISRGANVMAYLFHLGLLERLHNFTSYLPAHGFDITPSRLGIELYLRCKGIRRPRLDRELSEKADICLVNILAEAMPLAE